MTGFVLRRLVWILPNVLLLTFLLFAVVTGWLGSPAGMMLGTDASPEAVAALDRRYGFDQPIWRQYIAWVGAALGGDFGRSYATQQTVASMIAPAAPVTLELSAWAILLALVTAVGLNSLTVGRQAIGTVTSALSVIGVTIPNFMLGASLVYLFSVHLGWLPTTGWVPWSEGVGTHLRHLIMPVLTLFAFYFGSFTMIYRAEYRAVQRQLFVRVAAAKGLSDTRVSFRHVLPNAILPVVTYVGISAGHLIGGAVVTETVFSIPGLGRLFVSAIGAYDFPVMLAMGMIVLAGVTVTNLAADMILAAINPQIRL
ncbi:ABC transporter permease [Humitalea sp. 24SJ18S-53]|uniref:ABC transporter permease n=1 Tax=Humitalea sp. 24SJ18S-53 TaxID=3422307 RepID=UPI003D674109